MNFDVTGSLKKICAGEGQCGGECTSLPVCKLILVRRLASEEGGRPGSDNIDSSLVITSELFNHVAGARSREESGLGAGVEEDIKSIEDVATSQFDREDIEVA